VIPKLLGQKKSKFLAAHFFYRILLKLQPGLRSRTRKESEVFGWSRIPNNTGSRSRILLSGLRWGMSNWIIFLITLLN